MKAKSTQVKTVDPLVMVGLTAVRERLQKASQEHDAFMAEIYRRHSLDSSLTYNISETGVISPGQKVQS